MAYDYDKLYGTTPHALGEPTQIFVDFFKQNTKAKLTVLDIGCGQGRDALFIARMGHSVVGVDASPNGIESLVTAAALEKLAIEGVVADLEMYQPENEFDVLLIDRTLHMLSNEKRLAVLERLIQHVAINGWVLIADERSNMSDFKNVFKDSDAAWKTDLDKLGYLFLKRI